MNFIKTKLHGVIDYFLAIALIISPLMNDIAYETSAARYVPVVLGAMLLLINFCTDYPGGVAKVLDMRIHVLFDMGTGMVLALSPWIFGFSATSYQPHLYFGIALVLISLASALYLYATDGIITKQEDDDEEYLRAA